MNGFIKLRTLGVAVLALGILLFSPGQPAIAAHLADGLVAYWPFDDGTDPTADLAHIHNADLVPSSSEPTFDAGDMAPVPGNVSSLDFDGTDDYAFVADPGGADNLDAFSGLTLAAWINPDTVIGGQAIVSKYDTKTDYVSYYLSLKDDELRVFVGEIAWTKAAYRTTSGADLSSGSWVHVAGTWDGVALKLYVNGTEEAGADFIVGGFPTAMQDSSIQVDLGAFEAFASGTRSGFFDGKIDEVRIYDRALGGDDITSLYLTGDLGTLFVDVDGEVGLGSSLDCDGEGVFVYEKIQDAVDAASDGDTIKVCDGTYEEQVVIDRFSGLTLVAASTPIVQPAASAEGAIIWVKNSTGVTIEGFKVDGAENFAAGCSSGDARMIGIYYLNSSGTIQDNEVTRIRHFPADGCQEGTGIYAKDDNTDSVTSQVTIINNTVTDYQKGGVVTNLDVDATIHFNTVTGMGDVPVIAANGIQVGYGATASVKRNTVDGNWFTGADWSASGILVFESDDVTVQGNAVSGSQSGIAVEAWCWIEPSASYNKIVRNTIEDAEWGVSVAAYDLGGGYSTCNASADNNKVTNNTITATPGSTGVFVGTGSFWGGGGYTPSADNNKVSHNTISSGYVDAIVDDGTSSKVHANVFTP